MEARGYELLLKNKPRNETDLTSEVNVPSLNDAEKTKEELTHTLKEVFDAATNCCRCYRNSPTNSVVQSLSRIRNALLESYGA